MTDTGELLGEFRAFVAAMTLVEEDRPLYAPGEEPDSLPLGERTYRVVQRRSDPWWFSPNPGFDDFTKELCGPGVLKKFPEGAVGVRTDDNFWAEAVLPWRFRALGIGEIVAVLWPNVANPVLHPDVEVEPDQSDPENPGNVPSPI